MAETQRTASGGALILADMPMISLGWAQKDKADILRNIRENLRPGDIIFMHTFSGQSRSAEILPEIIEYILTQGYRMEALLEWT